MKMQITHIKKSMFISDDAPAWEKVCAERKEDYRRKNYYC